MTVVAKNGDNTTMTSTGRKSDYMKSATMSGSMPSSAGAGMSPEDIEEAVQLMKAIELEEKAKEVKFKFVNDLSKLYEVGDDVIPSDNGRSTVKAVVFAKSMETGRTVSLVIICVFTIHDSFILVGLLVFESVVLIGHQLKYYGAPSVSTSLQIMNAMILIA